MTKTMTHKHRTAREAEGVVVLYVSYPNAVSNVGACVLTSCSLDAIDLRSVGSRGESYANLQPRVFTTVRRSATMRPELATSLGSTGTLPPTLCACVPTNGAQRNEGTFTDSLPRKALKTDPDGPR